MEKFGGEYRKNFAGKLNIVRNVDTKLAQKFLKKEKVENPKYLLSKEIREEERAEVQNKFIRDNLEKYFSKQSERANRFYGFGQGAFIDTLKDYMLKIDKGVNFVLKKYEGKVLPKTYFDAINEYKKLDEEIYPKLLFSEEEKEKIKKNFLLNTKLLFSLSEKSPQDQEAIALRNALDKKRNQIIKKYLKILPKLKINELLKINEPELETN